MHSENGFSCETRKLCLLVDLLDDVEGVLDGLDLESAKNGQDGPGVSLE